MNPKILSWKRISAAITLAFVMVYAAHLVIQIIFANTQFENYEDAIHRFSQRIEWARILLYLMAIVGVLGLIGTRVRNSMLLLTLLLVLIAIVLLAEIPVYYSLQYPGEFHTLWNSIYLR